MLTGMGNGSVFGAACGYAFTRFQNRFNKRRDKSISISIAIAIWIGFNFAFAGLALLWPPVNRCYFQSYAL